MQLSALFASGRRTWAPRLAAYAGAFLLGLSLAGTVLALSAPWFWLGEIAASFRWQLGWSAVAGASVLAIAQHWWLALAGAGIGFLHVWPELGLRFQTRPQCAVVEELRVASANLLMSNRDDTGFVEWVRREDPDVLALLELSTRMKTAVEERLPEYPHHLWSPEIDGAWKEGTWGIGLISKRPLSSPRIVMMIANAKPVLEATIDTAGEALVVRVAHPPRPGREWRIVRRNEFLEGLATQFDWRANELLLGDLNITSYSAPLRELEARTFLRDSREGFDRLPTWCTTRWIPGMWICIDHILVGARICVLDRSTSTIPGSDHRAATARIGLRKKL